VPTRKGDKLRTPPRGYTRVQWALKGQRGGASITVPAALARLIGPDRLFQVELTAEGLLYRYVEGGEPVVLPDWLSASGQWAE